MDERTWWSKVVLIGGCIAALLLPIGALGSRFGMWPFTTGFLFVIAGVLIAAVCLVLGIVGLIVAGKRKRGADRPGLVVGTGVSVLILGLMFVQFLAAGSVPQIHNISTDTIDPPQFDEIAALREGTGANPLEYNDAVRRLQEPAYPDVQPLQLAQTPSESFDRALATVQDMGWELVSANRDAGMIEATDTTFWFGFKDDVAIRVRPDDGGSVIDVRSVSRVGRSDLGTNARRILQFLERVES